MAESAMSGSVRPGYGEGDDPLERAVWRLRSRGCWGDAAALLAPRAEQDAGFAVHRAALLVEGCLFTAAGWAEAEDAVRAAEALAVDPVARGTAACERGQLAYAATVVGNRDRSDEARAALGRAAALIPPAAPERALVDFRRGLLAEHLADNPESARAAYRRAHAGATANQHTLLSSFTWRHLAGLALRSGDLTEARHGFAESLRLREELGYLVGMAPALASLADVEAEPEAGRLRAEAQRLFRLLGGVPTWLEGQLAAA
ncbi:hypothetical protein MTQ01_14165 [Streptomyces sp. XM4193]|uniref:hypothetical protein n=1 Tax=Streptomyces sp. XM4193 TaxID=2929782 RepID=UPI001FFBB033|nr:hypothetical protein [Streptomyces sp. XM4193]MCK1797143.1 hypothetical protein [Streptomyces sp. XM4193]